jgi:hypothetical protein
MIDNAIDAMESRKDERRLEFAIQNNGNGMAAVRIRDNGCGIADDKLGKIFNPFYTSKETGTGLGLGVAKKVIDSHRGTIQVHSTVAVGTEFILEIPLSDAVRDAIDAVAALNGESAESADSPVDEATPQATQNLKQQKTQNLNGQVDLDAPLVTPGATSSETSRARN